MGAMKHEANHSKNNRPKLLARFGRLHLLGSRSGVALLQGTQGGAPTEVKEWIALFGHDVVLGDASLRP